MTTYQDKKKIISSFSHEVKELHPWLQELFPKLPNVVSVEYTHGREEMAADFVLTVKNPTLGRTRNVGLVVKCGKIGQHLREVEEQIDECSIPRKLFGGKVNSALQEVWVVSNGNITSGAKEKIHKKYHHLSVEFVDLQSLINLTDLHAPHLWSDLPTDVSSYFEALKKELTEMESRSHITDLPGLTNSYIPLELQEFKYQDFRPENEPKPFSALKLVDNLTQPLTIVEGEMGSGKSKLLRIAGEQLTDPTFFKSKRYLPIWLSCNRFLEEYGGVLEKAAASLPIAEGATPVFLVDGLDESLNNENSADSILNSLKDQAANGNWLVIVGSRPLENGVRFIRGDHKRYRIRELSKKASIKHLREVLGAKGLPTKLIADLNRSDLFKSLPQRPISIILLSQLLSIGSHNEIPSSMTDLYDKSIELMLGRWDITKGLSNNLEYQALKSITATLAKSYMEDRRLVFDKNYVKAVFSEYLEARNLDIKPDELYKKAVTRSGIIAETPSGNDVFFRHRSFAEFLTAWHIFHRANGVEQIPLARYWSKTWSIVCFFYVGLHRDCAQLLEDIGSAPIQNEEERFQKLLNMPSFLLAASNTPYQVTVKSLPGLFIEAAHLYVDMKNGQVNSELKELPEIFLLWVFVLLLKYSYSYSYFQQCLEDVAIQIWATNSNDEIKVYALFFLSMVGLDLEDIGPLKILNEEFVNKGRLPTSIAIALRAELDKNANSVDISSLLKTVRRKVDKDFKARPSIKREVDRLMKLPIERKHKKKKR
jgi:hypothetical protein